MDITLERILSLIPRKPDGAYKHGAKKEFAVSIGYDSGDVISMWEKGTSSSYRLKLHEIAAKYNVSVEWLKGETDEKTPAAENGNERIPGYDLLNKENQKFIDDLIDKLLKSQSAE